MTGFEGVTCGETGDLIDDFRDDLELPGADCGLVVEMGGAGLSAVHLHYPLVSGTSRRVWARLTLKNSPSVEL